MVTINNQLVLDEQYDENYLPTEQGKNHLLNVKLNKFKT